MSPKQPAFFSDVEKCVDAVIKTVGKKIVFGMPLGLGKANHVANELYRRAKEDPEIDLTILTALSLEKPTWTSEMERRFLEPFLESPCLPRYLDQQCQCRRANRFQGNHRGQDLLQYELQSGSHPRRR